MKIAVASGKGGTGKTCVAASLALSASDILAVDLDVEEPNLALLFGATPLESMLVTRPRPHVDENRCTGCGLCARECRFGAVNVFGRKVLFSHELCHGCGLCMHLCPTGAIFEEERPVGEMRRYRCDGVELLEGRLWTGQMNPVPVIESTLDAAEAFEGDAVWDCPPGTSCSMVAAVRRADAVILVTEPTPFGAADLELALQVLQKMGKKASVVINRCDLGEADIDGLCGRYDAPVAARLPFSREVASRYASGEAPARSDPLWQEAMKTLWAKIGRENP
jgi:MinD superfamily P-loop ATPase